MPPKKRSTRRAVVHISPASADWKPNKTVLVTGASGGIGYDLSSLFAQNGYNLVLIARSKDKLLALANQAQQMFGVSAKVIQKDLTRPGAAEEIFREVERSGIVIDILVNNAGYGLIGGFGYSSKNEELNMVQLNITSLVHMTKLFLAPMLKRQSGKILNVASTAAFQPGPLMTNYYATKAYVLSFSVGLAEEVRESGVTVSVLCPGSTLTGFHESARIKEIPAMRYMRSDSRTVARVGYEGLMAGKTIITPGFFARIGTIIVRVLSTPLAARVMMKFHEKRM